MRITRSKMALLALGVLGYQSAYAEEGKMYLEPFIMRAYYNEPLLSFYHGMTGLKVGYNIDKNIAIEAMGATNIGSASGYVGSTYITAQVSGAQGIYLKLKSDNPNGFNVYGKFGTTSGTVTASSAYGSVWTSGYSTSYGAGLQFEDKSNTYYTVEYMSYYSNSGVTVGGPSASIGLKF